MKYDVMHSCGHEERIELFGKEKDRYSRIEYLEKHGLCKECYLKERDARPPYVTLGQNGAEAVVKVGNAYKIKDELKTLGAKWNSLDRVWEIRFQVTAESKEMAAEIVKKLKEMGCAGDERFETIASM